MSPASERANERRDWRFRALYRELQAEHADHLREEERFLRRVAQEMQMAFLSRRFDVSGLVENSELGRALYSALIMSPVPDDRAALREWIDDAGRLLHLASGGPGPYY